MDEIACGRAVGLDGVLDALLSDCGERDGQRYDSFLLRRDECSSISTRERGGHAARARARMAGGMYLPGARDSASEHVAEDDADGELGSELDAVDVAGDTV